jgi:hypothetical protein
VKRSSIIISVILLGIASVLAPAQQRKVGYDQLLRPAAATFYHTPIGLCEDYPEETTTMEIIRADMELLKRSGINMLRISFGWDGIEEAKDQYNWLFWDDYVRMATEEYGITLIPYVCYTPMWNSTGDSITYWRSPPKDYDQFGKFVETLVNRYKPWIKSWEIWNEPDIEWFWLGTVTDFARLLKIGSDAVRRADPDAIVVFGGLAHETNFLWKLFRDHGISPYVDVVNIHNYNETWSGNPNEEVIGYVNTVADIVQRYGNGQSIWMAEIGYSTFRLNGRISEHYTATYDYEHTPAYQAVHLVRTLTMLLSTEKLAAIAWYEIKDLTTHEDVIGDDNNRHLGVATLHHEAKPAEHALRFFNKLFSVRVRSIDMRTTVVRTVGSQSQVHAFETEAGDVIVGAWLKTAVRGTALKDLSGKAQDGRSELIEVRLPMTLKGKATIYDELGNAKEFTSVERRGNETILKAWQLRGGEVALIKITK